MAMTSVADTRVLLALQFSSDEAAREKVKACVQKELASGIVLPSIVLSEFVKIASPKIGLQGAVRTLNLLKERGMKVKPVDEQVALEAGKLLLKRRDVPFADALIAAFVHCKMAEYVLSDDPHFQALGSKTRWF
jgi:predicted nucleic acid-binding protein